MQTWKLQQMLALRMGKCVLCAIFIDKHWHHTGYFPAGYLYIGYCTRLEEHFVVTHQAMVEAKRGEIRC